MLISSELWLLDEQCADVAIRHRFWRTDDHIGRRNSARAGRDAGGIGHDGRGGLDEQRRDRSWDSGVFGHLLLSSVAIHVSSGITIV